MKILNKFTYALMAISLVAVSCVQEETFKPGEEEDANCYGVFFPKQDASGFHEWDPADPTELVVKVSRKVATDAITVPLDVITTDEGIWECPTDIKFDAGQTDTSIVIKFGNAEMGVKYDGVTLEINDPKYASKYSSNASFFNFSVQKVKWNSLGTAVWHDSFIGGLFSVPYQPDLNVEVQERDDLKGFFRFKNVYGADYDFNEPGDYEEGDVWITIDASDPSAVDMDYQYMGLDWGYGPFYLGSTYQFYKQYKGYTDEQMSASYDISAMLGTYDTINNVISFPDGAAGVALPEDSDPLQGYWWDADGEFYVIMPGGKLVDYSLSIQAFETEEIEGDSYAPIMISTGADVYSVKYTVLQGALTQSQFDDEAAAIIRGTAKGIEEVKADAEKGALVFYTDTLTATYTIVAVAFDSKGTAQGYDRAEFGFVKHGDEIPVSAAFNAASIPGYTEDNEVVINVFGRDITDVKITYAEYATMMASQEAYYEAIASVYDAKSLDAAALEDVNENGYTAKIGGLLPGTRYVFMAYVFNGFKSDILLADVTTSGEPKKIYQSWNQPDAQLYAKALEEGASAYYGTYNYYARRQGHHDDNGSAYINDYNDILRAPIGQVKIEDADPEMFPTEGPDEYGLYDDYVMVTGLLSPYAEYWELSDTLIFDCYNGLLYNSNRVVLGELSDAYIDLRDCDEGHNATGTYLTALAFAEEGYISIFDDYGDPNYNFNGYALYAFDKVTEEKLGTLGSFLHDILLVDPAVDEETPAPAPTVARSASRRVFKPVDTFTRPNYIETEKGLRKSNIDRLKAQRRNASVQKIGITPVNDVVVPAKRAGGHIRVGIASEKNYSASASSSSLDKKTVSALKVRR